MKKFLLSTAALAALTVAAPAFAQEESGVKLNLGGHFKGYGVWVDTDTETNRSVDMIRETEVHFSGETTLDNGLTVGAHIEAEADQGDSFAVNESYAYFSGNWGRVNVGSEDGATFLMQVAAPSADSNFDGIRQYVNPFAESALAGIDYDHDVTGKADKVSYLSPVFSGFQVGASWTPENGRASSRGTNGVAADSANPVYEAAVRYEGNMNAVSVTAGAGYSNVSTIDNGTVWNAGLDLGMGAFGLGVAYMTEEDMADADNDSVDTLVFGADYTTGPFVLGVSYLNQDDEVGTVNETDRYAAGVTYAYGPGMTFRGSVAYQENDSTTDVDGTAVMLGTQVNF